MIKVRISHDRDGQKAAKRLQAAIVKCGRVVRVKSQRTDKYDRIYIDIEESSEKD